MTSPARPSLSSVVTKHCRRGYCLSIAALLLLAPIIKAATYSYDAQDRLIEVDYSGTKGVTYTYDAAGNLLKQASGVTTNPSGGGITPTSIIFTCPTQATFPQGKVSSFTVSATGFPAPKFGLSGAPQWLTINPTTGVFTGKPAAGGSYAFNLVATNGASPYASQAFLLTVPQLSQSISPIFIPSRQYSTNPFPFAPTSSSGLPVSVVLTGPASFSNNLITMTGVGPVMWRLSQSGNQSYTAAPPISGGFAIRLANQTIAPFPVIKTQTLSTDPAKNIISFTPPKASSGLPVTISGDQYVTVNNNGISLTLNGKGKATLTATQPGGANYYPARIVTTSFLVK